MEISILLWNVWNLPSCLTDGKSKTRAKKISPLLNAYDIVVLNEAFVNIKHLLSQTTHPYVYRPTRPWQTIFSPGLIFLSRFEIVSSTFEIYRKRSGVDRFAAKGIAQITVRLQRDGQDYGLLRVFGTHMQASHGDSAQKARHSQAQQAADFVQGFANDVAAEASEIRTVFAGDLNMGPNLCPSSHYSQHYHDDEDHLARTAAYAKLLDVSGLHDIDTWVDTARNKNEYEREICRMMLNSVCRKDSAELSYTLQEHTEGSEQLSDTNALLLRLRMTERTANLTRLRSRTTLVRSASAERV